MSYRNSSLQQDILLKHYVDEPEGARPGFNWGEALDEGEPLGSRGAVRLSTPQGERDLAFTEVADAIEDHYKPRFAGDELPRSDTGVAVALADKLETLVGMFGIGNLPRG